MHTACGQLKCQDLAIFEISCNVTNPKVEDDQVLKCVCHICSWSLVIHHGPHLNHLGDCESHSTLDSPSCVPHPLAPAEIWYVLGMTAQEILSPLFLLLIQEKEQLSVSPFHKGRTQQQGNTGFQFSYYCSILFHQFSSNSSVSRRKQRRCVLWGGVFGQERDRSICAL